MDEQALVLMRRRFLKLCLGAAAGFVLSPGLALASVPVRNISLVAAHTDESLNLVYWEDGEYIPDAMAEINRLLRDHRSGDIHPIDPVAIDLLYLLAVTLDHSAPFHVISGYRSPTTNAKLREVSKGVARHSLHLEGRAIDIRVPGVELGQLHEAALGLQAGGVGYYPRSKFVHIDTGPVRTWRGA